MVLQGNDLKRHILSTYTTLRYGLAVIAMAFPLILWLGGLMKGIELGGSMSAYYHLESDGGSMRDWFVGILFAVSIGIYLYKGYSGRENSALNLAGLFGVGIAVFPMAWPESQDNGFFSLHGACAVGFFLCIAYVCLVCAGETIEKAPENTQAWYRKIYKVLGAILIVSPLVAVVYSQFVGQQNSVVFFVEAFGIWAFAAYWLTKSREISQSQSEAASLAGT